MSVEPLVIGPNRRPQECERAAAERCRQAKRAEAERKANAKPVVEISTARQAGVAHEPDLKEAQSSL